VRSAVEDNFFFHEGREGLKGSKPIRGSFFEPTFLNALRAGFNYIFKIFVSY
jgi:hypothetical protein